MGGDHSINKAVVRLSVRRNIAEMAKQIATEYDLEIFEEYQDLGIRVQG
jgi:ADP-dependent phosphofructokinase/glucokinase